MRLLAESSAETTADPVEVWRVWTDPALRPGWHPRLEWATLDGPPWPGARGAWKPDRARPLTVTVAEAAEGRRLVFDGVHGLPVATGHYVYELAPLGAGRSRMTHRVALSGALAAPIARCFAGPLGVSASPEAVAAVIRLAEGRCGSGAAKPRR